MSELTIANITAERDQVELVKAPHLAFATGC